MTLTPDPGYEIDITRIIPVAFGGVADWRGALVLVSDDGALTVISHEDVGGVAVIAGSRPVAVEPSRGTVRLQLRMSPQDPSASLNGGWLTTPGTPEISIEGTVTPVGPDVVISSPTAQGSAGWYNAADTVPVPMTVTAEDPLDPLDRLACPGYTITTGGIGTSQATGSFEVAAEGVTSVLCEAENARDGITTAMAEVRVDSVPPTVDVTTPVDEVTVIVGAPLTLSYSCADATSGIGECAGTVTSGSDLDTTAVGPRTARVDAVDGAGNRTTVTRSYAVRYGFGGFAGPPPGTVITSGQTVPLMWTLSDATDAAITDPAAVDVVRMTSATSCSGPFGAVHPTSGGPVVADAATGTYGYEWDTSGLPAGCHRISLHLDDGSVHLLLLRLRTPTTPAPPLPPQPSPIAYPGGPYTATVGEVIVLDGSASSDPLGEPLELAWDLDGDGVFDALGETVEAVFDEEGEVEVTLRATAGSRSDTAVAAVTVTEPLPVVEVVDNVDRAIAVSQMVFPTSTFAQDAGPDAVLLGRDDLFADSLASGGAQGLLGAPLLLTDPEGLDGRVADEIHRLGATQVLLLGGETALSPAVEADLVEDGLDVRRLAGASRLETAIAVAAATAPDATRVVLSRAYPSEGSADPTQAFADALAAGALAADEGVPLLLTEPDRLSGVVASWLASSSVTDVLVVGGESAVGPVVRDSLAALGLVVSEVAGQTRASTATAIAAERGWGAASDAGGAVLVDGEHPDTWADAFPAALLSARTQAPVVLSSGAGLPAPTAEWLRGGGTELTLTCLSITVPTACELARTALRQ